MASLKMQKKEEKERKIIEQRLRHASSDALPEEFPDLDPITIEDFSDVLTGKAIGRSICHVWYDAETR